MASVHSATLTIGLLDELDLWIDTWSEQTTAFNKSKYWTITEIPNKGYGMIASTDIKAYTTISIEKPILFERSHQTAAQELMDDFNKLSANQQKVVMSLANVHDDDEKRNIIEGIYDTSACQTNTSEVHTSALFPSFARMNHSCLPNCTMYFKPFPADSLVVKTLFDIKQNTELTVCYLPRFKLTYHERQKLLKTRYKFDCMCSLCNDGTKHDMDIREYRLSIMNGNQHWNCIQTALDILNNHFQSIPTIKTNLLSIAIDCATEDYLYDNAYHLIVESIQLNIKCYGLHCKRWKEIHEQIQKLKSYSNDERCDSLLQIYQCLWHKV